MNHTPVNLIQHVGTGYWGYTEDGDIAISKNKEILGKREKVRKAERSSNQRMSSKAGCVVFLIPKLRKRGVFSPAIIKKIKTAQFKR